MAYSIGLNGKEGNSSLTFEKVKDVAFVFATDSQAKSIVSPTSVALLFVCFI